MIQGMDLESVERNDVKANRIQVAVEALVLYTKPVPMMTCAVTASGSQGIAIPPLQMILGPAPFRVQGNSPGFTGSSTPLDRTA